MHQPNRLGGDGHRQRKDALGGGARGGPGRATRHNFQRRRPACRGVGAAGRSSSGAARGARARGDLAALLAPGRSAGGGAPRAHDRHHRHGQRQVARVQPAGARHACPRPPRPRGLPLPHQGPGPGPGAQAVRAAGPLPAPRDLRRRHAARRAARDPRPLEPDPHEPGHAPRGRDAAPQELGRRVRQPRLGGGRRGARLPRRVRLARGQRAAAPAAAGERLRHRAALHAHERDDRQPGRVSPRS